MDTKEGKICGVILAAEIADSTLVFFDNLPRCMLPVGNKPVMQHQIEVMSKIGIKKIFIVVKYNKNKIINYFKDGKGFGVELVYIEQGYLLGIAHAVGQLEKHIDTPFLLFLSNIFFISERFEDVLKTAYYKNSSAVLLSEKVDESRPNDLYFGIILHESGMVKRVVEKPRYINSPFKGCGIYYFEPVIFDAIRRTPRTAMRDKYEITDSIQILIEDGYPVYNCDAISWYRHIISPEDLLLCNKKYLEINNIKNIIGQNTEIHSNAKVIDSVIGNNVRISNPIKIKNSVIFNNTAILSSNNIESSIVYMNESKQCKF